MVNCMEIIGKIKESRVKASIVRLLGENPNILDNVKGLAAWAALPESEVAPAADELADLGALKKYGQGVGAVYRLTKDTEVRSCIEQHFDEIRKASGRGG